jgi:hypothetical protein
MRHPAGNDRDVTDVHGSNVAIEFELELAIDNEDDLLFLVDMPRGLGVRLELDEVDHRTLAKNWRNTSPRRNSTDSIEATST